MLTFILLIFILGIIIFIHELGHFLTAKKAGVYIYEFALGFGPRIWSKKGKKDGIIYALRLFPIGGFVQMAGEVYEDDKKIPKERFMCNKSWIWRVIILVAGVTFNFILAIVLLFVSALIWGSSEQKPIIGELQPGYPAEKAGIVPGDTIVKVNGKKVKTWDKFIILINLKDKDGIYDISVKKENGEIKNYSIEPQKDKDEDGNEKSIFGFALVQDHKTGFLNAIKYSFTKFGSVIDSMAITIGSLFTGKLSLNSLSGPVGIYSVVGESAKLGIESLLYLTAFLSINVGFINILPFPAFDGGRVLFLIIEKIKGSPINSKIENVFHTIGFILLMALMVYITFQDILRLF